MLTLTVLLLQLLNLSVVVIQLGFQLLDLLIILSVSSLGLSHRWSFALGFSPALLFLLCLVCVDFLVGLIKFVVQISDGLKVVIHINLHAENFSTEINDGADRESTGYLVSLGKWAVPRLIKNYLIFCVLWLLVRNDCWSLFGTFHALPSFQLFLIFFLHHGV